MKIKPCPFCGGEAKKQAKEVNGLRIIYVECEKCGASSGIYKTRNPRVKDEENPAIKAWNRRESIDKIVEQLEELGRLIVTPETGIGDLSDGYHTFNELYHHRAVLFSVICNAFKSCAWKSKMHSDGTMHDGMFIVGIDTPEGSATYHYDIKPYWDMFDVKELNNAPEWDGHTPDDAINRIARLSKSNRLIELPCAFGDKVYSVYKGYDIRGNKTFHIENEAFRPYMLAGYGKHVFLTKEEAEAKLKELEGGKE